MTKHFLPISCLIVASLLFPVAVSAEPVPYHERPEGQAFINELARNYGFEPERTRQWLARASYQERIIELISRPAERTLEWHQYRDIFIKPERIESGKAFLQEHEVTFTRAEETYGVPREIIAAIIGVETWYGRHMGTHRVLDALTTLAFDYPPRSAFFRRELVQYFLMAREQGFEAGELKGSYAGAMGYGQFISSSYRHYAVDFDDDGVVDIFENPVDAIGSVANYFSEHRWREGRPVAHRLDLTSTPPAALMPRERRPSHTVSDIRKAGQDLARQVPDHVADSEPARLIKVISDQGTEYWLTYHNFYVITRYNHSHLYAMAVHELARHLGYREKQESH